MIKIEQELHILLIVTDRLMEFSRQEVSMDLYIHYRSFEFYSDFLLPFCNRHLLIMQVS